METSYWQGEGPMSNGNPITAGLKEIKRIVEILDWQFRHLF